MGATGPLFWLLLGAGAIGAIAHGLFFLERPISLARALVKTSMMAALTAAFALTGAHPILIVALAAAACGDFLLAFDKTSLLPLGILAFLIAQIGYLVVFFFGWLFAGDLSPLWPRYAAMALIICAALGFLLWMAPKLGRMALAVIPYALAITAMAAMAMWLEWRAWPAMLGVLFFLVSDFVLAAELFRLPPDAPARRITGRVVWWTYVAAQFLIAAGIALQFSA